MSIRPSAVFKIISEKTKSFLSLSDEPRRKAIQLAERIILMINGMNDAAEHHIEENEFLQSAADFGEDEIEAILDGK